MVGKAVVNFPKGKWDTNSQRATAEGGNKENEMS